MSKVALIDADGLIYIVAYCKQKRDEGGMPLLNDLGHPDRETKTLDQCKAAMDDIIKNILLASGAREYLMFLTVGKNFRYKIYSDYKANRKSLEKPEHFDRIKEYLITDYKAVYHTDLEADDLCLIYSKKIPDSFIVSPDKDILGLEGTHYNYNKGEWITVDRQTASYNLWKSVITGDTADNIKGIPGKGEKFASVLLGDADIYPDKVLLAYIDKFGEEEGVEEFYKNYKVLKIRDKYDGLVYSEPMKFESKVKKDESEKGNAW